METRAINRKLMKQLTDERLRLRTFGKQRAIKIGARLDEFKAAQHLTEISSYPPARLHPLHGDHEGLFSVDVSANFRMIFAGFNQNGEQSVAPSDVTIVMIVEVEDYH